MPQKNKKRNCKNSAFTRPKPRRFSYALIASIVSNIMVNMSIYKNSYFPISNAPFRGWINRLPYWYASCIAIIAYIHLSANQNSIGQLHPRRTSSGSDVYIFFRPFFPSFRWPCCTKFPSTFLRKYEESLIFNREAISATL